MRRPGWRSPSFFAVALRGKAGRIRPRPGRSCCPTHHKEQATMRRLGLAVPLLAALYLLAPSSARPDSGKIISLGVFTPI